MTAWTKRRLGWDWEQMPEYRNNRYDDGHLHDPTWWRVTTTRTVNMSPRRYQGYSKGGPNDPTPSAEPPDLPQQ